MTYRPFYEEDSKDPTGWLDPSSISVSYSVSGRTITLTGTLTYYWRGEKRSLSSPWTSDAHTNSAGNYYLYSTDGETFAWSTTTWAFSDLMVAKAVLSTSPAYQYAAREVHGLMPWQAHEVIHFNISAYRVSGGALDGATYTVNTASDAANSPGFDAAVIQDEDIATTIPAWSEGTYTTFYIGASGKATFDTTATLPFRSGGSYLYYNTPSTGAETAASNNRYLNVYQILVPAAADADSQKYRVLMLQPQAQYTSLAAAQAEDVRGLSLGDLATFAPEFVVYARITYVTASGDSNTGKCRIATGGITYIFGNRLSMVASIGVSAENVPFVATGNIAATDVQAALAEVDSEKMPLAGGTFSGDVTIADGKNIVLNTTTGTKIGTSASQKLGFFNVTPVVQPSAFTQTYSTSSASVPNPTAATLTDNSGGTANTTLESIGTTYSQTAVRNNFADLASMVNKNTADTLALYKVVTKIIDDLQALGLLS